MITIYATTTCAYCTQVEKYMQMKQVAYEKVYIDDNPSLRQKLLEITGALTVPITTNGKDYIVGLNFGRLAQLVAS